MKKRLQRRGKGFTLLELLIVVVVLAVLAGLALPQYIRTVGRAKESEGWQVMASIRSAEMRYYAEWEAATADLTLLDITDPNANEPRYFSYTVAPGALDAFDITADPRGAVGRSTAGVRTLTLSSTGLRTEQ